MKIVVTLNKELKKQKPSVPKFEKMFSCLVPKYIESTILSQKLLHNWSELDWYNFFKMKKLIEEEKDGKVFIDL